MNPRYSARSTGANRLRSVAGLVGVTGAILLGAQVNSVCRSFAFGQANQTPTGTKAGPDLSVLRERLKSQIPLTAAALNRFNGNCSDWDQSPDISVDASGLITTFKHEIRDLVASNLQLNPNQDASSLKETVISQLQAIGLTVGEPEWQRGSTQPGCSFPYGAVYAIEAAQPAENMFAVTTSLGVVCGEDTSLYIFERAAANWKLVLAREANGYNQVSGAQGGFHYAISPRDSSGHYFVVSSDVSPWCSSNWQALRYRVERPGSSAANSSVIMSGEGTIYLGDESSFKLSATADSFRLEYPDEFRNDTGKFVRTHVLSYQVKGNHAIRIAPIAVSPEDFVDEWMVLPWDQAEQWSSKSNLDNVKLWHDNLRPIDRTASLGAIDFVRECASDKWQIEMSVWNGEDFQGKLPDELYFTVVQRTGVYYMERVGLSEDASCK